MFASSWLIYWNLNGSSTVMNVDAFARNV